MIAASANGCVNPPNPEIDEELAEGTDEGDGHGPATLVTWGEDGRGDGQDREIDWGTVEDYAARRWWRGRRQ